MHTLRWRTAAPGTCAPPELLPKIPPPGNCGFSGVRFAEAEGRVVAK